MALLFYLLHLGNVNPQMTRCLSIKLGNIRFGVRCNVPYEIVHISEEVCVENEEVLRYHTGAFAGVFCIFGNKSFKAVLPAAVNDEDCSERKLGDRVFAVAADVLLICTCARLGNGRGCLACRVPRGVLDSFRVNAGIQ